VVALVPELSKTSTKSQNTPKSTSQKALTPTPSAWRITWLYGLLLVVIVVLAGTGNLGGILSAIHRVPLGDKIAHFVLVGLLAYVVNLSMPGRVWRFGRVTVSQGTLWVLVVVVLEEISQHWLPSRRFDVGDLLANVLGIAVFGWLAMRRERSM
jgi:polysaccharide biosynthesis protein VpsQ